MLSFLPAQRAAGPIRDAWETVDPDVVKVASAFASDAGFTMLRAAVGKQAFDRASKEWLIGIYEGVSGPGALTRMMDANWSEVRIPLGRETLDAVELRGPQLFHPKAYYLENTANSTVAIISTSANLTVKGLRQNVEQAQEWRGKCGDRDAVAFRAWWQNQWAAADGVTKALIKEYEDKRPKFRGRGAPRPNPPKDSTLQRASSLWIELTRQPEGGSFNQIDLLYNCNYFFFPAMKLPSKAVDHPRTFEDRLGNVYGNACQVSYNGRPRRKKGNSMWRVYMPTLAQGFSGYQDGDVLVRFDRTSTPDHYRIDVAPSVSPRALEWIENSSHVERKGKAPRRMGWS